MLSLGSFYVPNISTELAQNPGRYSIGQKKPEQHALAIEKQLQSSLSLVSTATPRNAYLQGLLHLKGLGAVKPNVDQALKELAHSGDPQAYYLLGVTFLKGMYGVSPNIQLGMQYLEAASQRDSTLASVMLGLLLWIGAEGVQKDGPRANQLLDKGLYGDTLRLPALSLETNRAIVEYQMEKTSDIALQWIAKLPAPEQANCYRRLGDAILKNAKNYPYYSDRIAAAWSKMAAAIPKNQTLSEAEATTLISLGRIYYCFGEKNKKQYVEAVSHFSRAAEADHPMGHYYLGLAYCAGKGVAKDLAKGKACLQRAADQKFLPATIMLNQIEKKETPLKPVNVDSSVNAIDLPAHEERDAVEANKSFLGKTWTWFRNHRSNIMWVTITCVAVAALITGLVALTICFPHVMVPIWMTSALFGGAVVLFFCAFGAFGH